ncbi:MAG: hypothetical protein QF637_09545 [Acidimicrobiales bacterium]|nr:hypothetical protein [Acidimicrobiales bacterium]
MAFLGVTAVLVTIALAVLLWRVAAMVQEEVTKTLSSLNHAGSALGEVATQSERAHEHIERIAGMRLRRMFVSLISRYRRRRRSRLSNT